MEAERCDRASGVASYDVDVYGDPFIREPFPHYAAMRALGPVVWLPRHGNYAVTRYAEVREVLRDWRVFSSAQGVAADEAGCTFLKGNTLASDPPVHDAMRVAMGAPLLPGALAAIRGRIAQAAASLVDDLVARRHFDGIADLARFLPLTIVTELVGLPEDGRDNMLSWAAASFDILGIQNERGRKGIETIKEMRRWITTQATADRLKPGSWTVRIHQLAASGRIEADVCPLLIRDYINPSLDTTISATGQLIYQLGQNPDQWRLLRERPELIPNAVNEAVRLGSPIRSFSRTVTQDYVLSGTRLPEGCRLMVLFASANRDERKFEHPDRFDVTRPGSDHVGFGHGIHMCVGMHLARLEMEALLEALVARVGTIAVGEPTIALNNTIHAFASLPVSVQPAANAAAAQVGKATIDDARPSSWIVARVGRLTQPAADVAAIELVAGPGGRLPPFTAGAHLDVEAAPGIVRQYSLCSDPGEEGRYRIAVLREPNSRGGSIAIHERVRPGMQLRVRKPRNLFPLDEAAERSLLFAGGIGITPILAMARRLHALERDFVLHYSARSRRRAAFVDELLQSAFADKVRLHFSDQDARLEPRSALTPPAAGLHAYVCGPRRFIAALADEARRLGWPDDHFHVERFAGEVDAEGAPFTLVAERSGRIFEVPRDKTILAVLQDAGIEVASSCQSGVCATCLTDVIEGKPDHRDLVQTAEEKATNRRIAVCCSRARSRVLVLDI